MFKLKAARLAVKLEHIYDSTPETLPLEQGASLDVLAVNNTARSSTENAQTEEPKTDNAQFNRWNSNNNSDRTFRPHQNMRCYGCDRLGHIRRNCRASPRERVNTGRDSYRRGEGEVQCFECGGRGHYADRCANRQNSYTRDNGRQDQRREFNNDNRSTGNNAPLNEQTTGRFPVHASRQSQNQ